MSDALNTKVLDLSVLPADKRKFVFALVGSASAGKKNLVSYLKHGNMYQMTENDKGDLKLARHHPNSRLRSFPMTWHTNKGLIQVTLVDSPGQELDRGDDEKVEGQHVLFPHSGPLVDGCWMVFDIQNRSSIDAVIGAWPMLSNTKKLGKHGRFVCRAHPLEAKLADGLKKVPVVICAHKIDRAVENGVKTKPRNIKFTSLADSKDLPFFQTSLLTPNDCYKGGSQLTEWRTTGNGEQFRGKVNNKQTPESPATLNHVLECLLRGALYPYCQDLVLTNENVWMNEDSTLKNPPKAI